MKQTHKLEANSLNFCYHKESIYNTLYMLYGYRNLYPSHLSLPYLGFHDLQALDGMEQRGKFRPHASVLMDHAASHTPEHKRKHAIPYGTPARLLQVNSTNYDGDTNEYIHFGTILLLQTNKQTNYYTGTTVKLSISQVVFMSVKEVKHMWPQGYMYMVCVYATQSHH